MLNIKLKIILGNERVRALSSESKNHAHTKMYEQLYIA